jgi:hypothetical protein
VELAEIQRLLRLLGEPGLLDDILGALTCDDL